MTIQVLSEKHVAARAIARQLGVTEGTVRYHLGRARQSAVDGRKGKRFVAAEFVDAIDAWLAESGRDDRPVNARDLYEHLARVRGYRHSYKSVLRYLRRRFGYPRIRTYRRVETPPGAQSQTDWGEFPKIDLGYGPQRVHAFVMALSFSRRPAIVWSLREDQVSWLACHNRAFERLGGIAAVNRIDNLRTAIAQQARQLAGVDLGDRDDPAGLQPFGQRDLAAPVARATRHVANDQAGCPDLAGFVVEIGAAGVADMRIGQRDQLAGVGRVAQDFLIAGDRGVEHDFADGQAGRAYGFALEYGAVFEDKDCGFGHGVRLCWG